MNQKTKTLILITDYASDTLARTEVILAIKRRIQKPLDFHFALAEKFNTIHTGFLADQLRRSLTPKEAANTIFFLNTDPRTHTKTEIPEAGGALLLVAKLTNQSLVISPNAGYCLSFIKPKISELFTVKVPNKGTQFRSRDIFPKIIAQALDSRLVKSVLKPTSIKIIPDLPKHPFVLHIDNYGNIKTSITSSKLKELNLGWGDNIGITIKNKKVARAKITKNIFADKPGRLVLAPGSSGDPLNPYFELSVRTDGYKTRSASELLGHPWPGSIIKISKRK